MKQYLINLFLVFSKLWRTILGGDGSETVSQATARAVKAEKWFAKTIMMPVIDTLFYVIMGEKDHVMNSLVPGPGVGKTIWDWSK